MGSRKFISDVAVSKIVVESGRRVAADVLVAVNEEYSVSDDATPTRLMNASIPPGVLRAETYETLSLLQAQIRADAYHYLTGLELDDSEPEPEVTTYEGVTFP